LDPAGRVQVQWSGFWGYEWPETPVIWDQSGNSGNDSGSGSNGEMEGATEEEAKDSNDSGEASQSGDEMDWQ
jgi:hypothetical protein